MVLDPRESSCSLSSSVWLHQLATSLKLYCEVCFVVSAMARKTCVQVLHKSTLTYHIFLSIVNEFLTSNVYIMHII